MSSFWKCHRVQCRVCVCVLNVYLLECLNTAGRKGVPRTVTGKVPGLADCKAILIVTLMLCGILKITQPPVDRT